MSEPFAGRTARSASSRPFAVRSSLAIGLWNSCQSPGTLATASAFVGRDWGTGGPMLLRSGVLWRQAENCLRLSRDCSDPHQAEQLRRQAHELFQQAIETEHRRRSRLPDPEDR